MLDGTLAFSSEKAALGFVDVAESVYMRSLRFYSWDICKHQLGWEWCQIRSPITGRLNWQRKSRHQTHGGGRGLLHLCARNDFYHIFEAKKLPRFPPAGTANLASPWMSSQLIASAISHSVMFSPLFQVFSRRVRDRLPKAGNYVTYVTNCCLLV